MSFSQLTVGRDLSTPFLAARRPTAAAPVPVPVAGSIHFGTRSTHTFMQARLAPLRLELPSAGAAGAVLTNVDGLGTLGWSTGGGSGPTPYTVTMTDSGDSSPLGSFTLYLYRQGSLVTLFVPEFTTTAPLSSSNAFINTDFVLSPTDAPINTVAELGTYSYSGQVASDRTLTFAAKVSGAGALTIVGGINSGGFAVTGVPVTLTGFSIDFIAGSPAAAASKTATPTENTRPSPGGGSAGGGTAGGGSGARSGWPWGK